MLCQQCNENNANIQINMIINGQRKEIKLCHECYSKEKQTLGSSLGPNMNSFPSFPFDNFFIGHSSHPEDVSGQSVPQSGMKTGQGGFIDQFGQNLTQMAKAGLIDPVIGRDEEVKRVIEILNRRNKNNPVLIGEPGVGKTAIAEGLAQKIAEGDVPGKLRNKEVYLLDVASLVANTGIRGQFEERMKKVISELQERKNIILFIDEIHLLVGAGSAEGSMDAGNILKPALARG
ncbi:MAG: AAA family ATPase, partial [Bacillus sp. (in: firmicutes)]